MHQCICGGGGLLACVGAAGEGTCIRGDEGSAASKIECFLPSSHTPAGRLGFSAMSLYRPGMPSSSRNTFHISG